MSGFLDYSNIMEPTHLESVSGPMDAAVTFLLKQREDAAQQKAKLDLLREVERRKQASQEAMAGQENARQDLRERRFQAGAELENTRARSANARDIFAAAGQRDLPRAEQLANDYGEVNPQTGAVTRGRSFRVVPEAMPTRPQEPMPAPVPSVEAGPRISEGDAARAARTRAAMNPSDNPEVVDQELERAQLERGRMAGNTQEASDRVAGANAAQTRVYQQQLEGFRAEENRQRTNPNPTIELDGTRTTPDDIRHSASRAAAGDFATIGDALGKELADATASRDPRRIAEAQRKVQRFEELRPQVESGALALGKAADQVNRASTAEGARDQALELQDMRGKSALDVQALRNQRPISAGGAANLDFKEKQLRSGNLRKDIKSWKETWNAKTTNEAAFEFPNIIKKLESGNAKLQIDALVTMFRIAQKDNRFSDADAKLAINTSAGWLPEVENWIARGSTGSFGEGVINQATAAARSLNGYYQTKRDRMRDDAQSFTDPTYYDPGEAANILSREVPGFLPSPQQGAGTPAPKKAGRRMGPVPEAGLTRAPRNKLDDLLDKFDAALGGM